MRIATLLTHNNLKLPCVILIEKPISNGKEVLVYAQSRLVQGYIEDDNSLVSELNIVVNFILSPELEDFIKNNAITKPEITITDIYYV